MPTPCPPLDEQVRIADAIDHIVTNIGDGMQGIRREIELLREYRTRLTADVVTGKLDVRETDVQLPGKDGLQVINPFSDPE